VKRSVLRFAAAFAATALSGFLYSLAYPPLRAEWLAFVALVPFLLALRAVGWRAALFLCWFWPVFASSFVADALPAAVETYFLQPPLVSQLFAVGVWTLTGSIYYMLFGPAYRALAERPGIATPLLAGAAWAACELLRGRLFTGSSFFVGNPWALLAYSQADAPALLQIASLGGPYAITFVVASVNAGLAEWLATARRGALAWRPLAVGFAPLGAALAWGTAMLRATPPAPGAAPVEVAIVQGDIDLGSVWRSDFYGRNLEVYLQGTLNAADRGAPRVVFWPEAALTFFLEQEPLYAQAIGRVLAAKDLELVVGGPANAEGEADRYFNSVFLLDPRGTVRGRYDKQYLVPFSEFFPLSNLDFLRRRFERVRSFAFGRADAQLLATRAGRVGVLTCNEAMLPEVARARVLAGAEILASPSNDSWIRSEKWAELMFDMVALRAVETGRYLVRASTSGPSAIIDPHGRVLARTEPFSRDVALGPVRARSATTLYVRVGDAFGFGCALVVGAVLVLRSARGRSV
jgi:apolipoprotein N-acyltransferase